MSKLGYIIVCTALITQSVNFPKVVNAQNSLAPFSPQILPCSYGDGEQCGFGKEDGSDQSSSVIDSLYAKASDASYEENYAEAFQIYTRIISLDPQEAQAYFNRGSIKQSNLNDSAGAEIDFRIAAKLFRQQGDDYMTRASIQHIQELRSSNDYSSSTANTSSSGITPEQKEYMINSFQKAMQSIGNAIEDCRQTKCTQK
jgi:tetratricopeptide (TPR) repeat protein